MKGKGVAPDRFMATGDAAIVTIQGLIPPGASKGTTFDLLVTALPGTQTTSLEGGQLWTADLSVEGDSPTLRHGRILAKAHGAVYLNPLNVDAHADKQMELNRQGVVLAGGVVGESRQLSLVLNQPNWMRSRAIADRINTRFGREPFEKLDTAVAESDSIVVLNIPHRYARQPAQLLSLILHLYLSDKQSFEPAQAQLLGGILLDDPSYSWATDVMLCWTSLGMTALPTIRGYYTQPDIKVRLAALEAGVQLEDATAAEPLVAIAHDPDPALRKTAAELLAYLPRVLTATETLQELLKDPDRSVRLAAYDALARNRDPVVMRVPIGPINDIKFELDVVPSDHPLVYVKQADKPYLVVFGPVTGFKFDDMAKLWDNRLMLRREPGGQLSVFYQAPRAAAPRIFTIVPAVANLARLMASDWSADDPTEGMNLSYSQVVNALFTLYKQGGLDADMVVQESQLAQAINKVSQPRPIRPITSPEGPPTTQPQRQAQPSQTQPNP
jgi:hypothetical protein